MRINVFGTRGFPLIQGGVEKHCECLYPLLSDKCDITVFRRKPYVNQKNRNADNLGIHFVDLPSTKIKGIEAALHSFFATIYSLFQKPDIVHIHNIGPAFFSPILKLRKIKVVLTYHSANYEHDKWGWFAKKLLKWSERIAMNTADTIIFVNKFQQQKYSDEIQKKSFYIPNGINSAVISQQDDFITSLGLEKQKYILSVGRITLEKGFDVLIKAFLKAELYDYKLVIAGGVEGEEVYFKTLSGLDTKGQVVFPGFIQGNKLSQLYSHAALFVLSSYNEGFPIVLLEAMSYHLPILASDIEANKMVEMDISNYFPVGNVSALTNQIKETLLKPYSSQDYSLEEFDWQSIADQTFNVYASKNSKDHSL
ncbi:glycosyltransferase family 4 protein [Bacteroidales bacterium OttesenSCG-928-M11]|nr:glycosyltransferase family 4 protein [Bacteroidales bacterium OttesenSCG-928-M11]